MALSIKESIAVSLSDFTSRKLRSIITIFSIVLGTLSIVVVQSMVLGVKESTLEWMMERGGMTRIDIHRNWEYRNPRNLDAFLTLKEFNELKRRIPNAKAISPELITYGRLSRETKFGWGSMAGVLPDFPAIEEWSVAQGRFINDFDIKNSMDTIVLGSTLKDELFGNINPIGKFVTFQERRFFVIGVMERRFYSFQGVASQNMLEYYNRRAYLPISTMVSKLSVPDRLEGVTIHSATIEGASLLREEIEHILLSFRNNEPVFSVVSALEQSEGSSGVNKVFGIVMFIISIISLVVAGVVIMNITLASIKERTREIGVRMAVGANRLDIFLQFMIQTLLFTTFGGVLGVITGLSVLGRFSDYIGIRLSGGPSIIVTSLIVSVSIGVIFGILPAIKASNLDPVRCLAYE